jgi:hypothetical protein
MQTAEYNHQDFEAQGSSEADKQLMVKFLLKPKRNNAKSIEAGRDIFDDTEYVDIRVMGNNNTHVCRVATYADRQRFPQHYEMFKRRVEPAESGTPLATFPVVPASMVEQLSFLNVKTVEALVGMSDNDVSKVMGLSSIKEKAKKFMEYSDKAAVLNQAEALETENTGLKAKIADQEDRLAKLEKMIAQQAIAKVEEETVEPEVEQPKAKSPRRQRAQNKSAE